MIKTELNWFLLLIFLCKKTNENEMFIDELFHASIKRYMNKMTENGIVFEYGHEKNNKVREEKSIISEKQWLTMER